MLSTPDPNSKSNDLIHKGGEMGDRIRNYDWSATPLGAIVSWPKSLQINVNAILQSTAPIVIFWGKACTTLYNDAYIAYAGHRHPVLLGENCAEIWHEGASLINGVLETCLNGNAKDFDRLQFQVYRNQQYEDVWVRVNASPLFDDQMHPAGAFIVHSEITTEVLQKEKLDRSDERYEIAMDAADMVGTWDWHMEQDLIFADPQFAAMFSIPPEQGETGAAAAEYLAAAHPDDLPGIKKAIETSIREKTKYAEEYRLIHKDGNIRWVSVRGRCFYDEEDNPVRFSGMAIDITDRKNVEKALRESELRLRRLIDSNIIGILHWNLNGNIIDANEAFLAMIGYEESDIVNNQLSWDNLTTPETKGVTAKAVKELQQKDTFSPFEKEFYHKNGDVVNIIMGGAFYEGSRKEGIAWVLDITERKRAERELKHKNKQLMHINNDLDNFIYTASHDLKAPISNIEGLVNAMKHTLQKSENHTMDDLVGMIYKSIDRFKNTIRDLTEVAKVHNNLDEDLHELPFEKMMAEVKEGINADIQTAKAKIVEDYVEAPSIYFSKKNLRSILYNLLSNAIKYRSPDRNVVVKVSTKYLNDDSLLLTVEDNGLGIKPEDHSKVFAMFKRLHQHVDGTGIGMAIVKKIIDNNGGTITIESKEGEGTQFKVLFKLLSKN